LRFVATGRGHEIRIKIKMKMKIKGRQKYKSLIVNREHGRWGTEFGPDGAGPYRVVCVSF